MGFAMRSSQALTILATLVVLGQSGCSFVLVDGPPSPTKVREFHPLEECTDSLRSPTFDTIAAVVLPAFALLKLASLNGDDKVVAVPAIAFAGIFAASAIWGYHTVGRCRRYLEPPAQRRRTPAE
jgi:hypothetical protein